MFYRLCVLRARLYHNVYVYVFTFVCSCMPWRLCRVLENNHGVSFLKIGRASNGHQTEPSPADGPEF